jgi:ferric-dicitrate binding protein FerR (iron transport regulator)
MKENMNPDDTKLSALLRQGRVSPDLPPRFQENVWRRIENAEAPVSAKPGLSWLDALAALVLRPRFALATATALVVAGALLGARAGDLAANQTAQAQYLTAVAPPAMR